MGAPGFQEDPELLAAVGGGSPPPFQEDDELLQALQAPQGGGGKVIEMPVQQIEGNPSPSLLDSLLRGAEAAGSGREQGQRLTAEAAPWLVGNMARGATAHLADPYPQQRVSGDPAADRAAEILGTGLNPVNYIAAPAAGEGIAMGAVRGALAGGINSGAQRYADDPNATMGDIASSAGRGALPGALGGAGASMLARGLGGAAQDAGAVANDARLSQANMPTAGMDPAARAALAREIEQAGFTDGIATGRQTIADRARSYAGAGDARMRTAEGQINQLDQPPTVDIGDIIDAQRSRAGELGGLADARGNNPIIDYRNDIANRLEADAAAGGPNGELPWARALEQRRNIDANSRFGSSEGPDASVNAARREIGNDLRGATDRALNSPSVPPELAGAWRSGRDQESLGLSVADAAAPRTPMQVPDNIPLSPAAAARAAVQATGSGRGAGLVADTMRGAQNALGAGADMTQASPAAAAAFQQWMATKMPAQNQNGQSRPNDSARGGLTGNIAYQLATDNPQALGKYAQQFQAAAQSGGVEAVRALVTKLALSDSEFRNSPEYMQIQQQSGQMP